MIRLMYIYAIVAVAFLGLNVYYSQSKRPQASVSDLAQSTTSPQYFSYLEAPASSEFYSKEPEIKVLATTIRAPKYLPISAVAEPLTEILSIISKCESGNNPLAKNPSSSAKGLLQILDGTWQSFQCEGNVLNGNDNFQCGLKIAQESGLHHWNASRSCWNKLLTSK